MKILALCTSPYQLLVVNRLIDEVYENASITIAIADTIANSTLLYERTKREPKFANVFLWKIKSIFPDSRIEHLKNLFFRGAQYKRYTDGLEGIKEVYDVFLYSNISPIAALIIGALCLRNPGIHIEMFEDGFSTYSNYTGSFLQERSLKAWLKRRNFWRTEKLYVFNPEIMEWSPDFELKGLAPVFEGECLQRVNRIFGYNALEDDYSKKVIFFEESYSADGKEVDDVDLVNVIAEIVGKENVFVKTHPRNPTNRFESIGYSTNKNTTIPWEVIFINRDFSKSIFVTMASNAAMNPFFLFGKRTPAFLLFKCSKTPEAMYPSIVEFDNRLCSKYPDVFYIPSSYDEMKQQISNVYRG